MSHPTDAPRPARPTRRLVLGAALATPVAAGAALLPGAAPAAPTAPTSPQRRTTLPEVRALERRYAATIGFHAARIGPGCRVLAHHDDVRAPIHSVFKAYAAA